MARPAATGYFPRGESVLRRVHGARIVGVTYGQRALLMQATDPLAFAGLMQDTSGLEAPFRRLSHTAKVMERVFFGSHEQADRETARVRRMHARVRGTVSRPAGRHPAGTPYAADDPEFLLWILACTADSAQAAYERFVRRLADRERERFWADYRLLGELFGLPGDRAPASYRDYRAYMRDRLHGEDLHVTEQAREIGRRVAFRMPLPAHRQPALAVVNLAVVGLLPERVRHLYGIGWDAQRDVAMEALASALRIGAWVAPARLRRGSSVSDYEVVARSEARSLRDAA